MAPFELRIGLIPESPLAVSRTTSQFQFSLSDSGNAQNVLQDGARPILGERHVLVIGLFGRNPQVPRAWKYVPLSVLPQTKSRYFLEFKIATYFGKKTASLSLNDGFTSDFPRSN